MSSKVIHVLHGPNLNLLGTREPEIYGRETLGDIDARIAARAAELGYAIEAHQSNHEGQLVDWLQAANAAGAHAVLLNAGAYTHTSLAIHDAIRAIKVPVIEVHLSNPHLREEFRHKSFVGMAAKGTVCGFGPDSYLVALEAAVRL
ncbi:MAG: type 3-dehydroquinate dehydratase [Pseudomonadota bacterium]